MARAGSLAIKTHAKAFDGSGRAREGKRGGVGGGGGSERSIWRKCTCVVEVVVTGELLFLYWGVGRGRYWRRCW